MASCDMCGKPATTRAKIEGVLLTVCATCAAFGTVPPAPKSPSPSRGPAAPRTHVPLGPPRELVTDAPQRLRAARQRLKLTEEEAAQKLLIHKSTLLHFESGRMVPDDATARRLERFYSISLFEEIGF